MSDDARMWRRGYSAAEIVYVQSIMAAKGPERDQEDNLPFHMSPDMWPLVALHAEGVIVQFDEDGAAFPTRTETPLLMSWRELARLHASMDEITRKWPSDVVARYNAECDQAVMEYRAARIEFEQREGS